MIYYRIWKWLRLSPIAVIAFIVVVTILPIPTTPIIGGVWFCVSVASAAFSDLLRRRTKRAYLVSLEESPEESDLHLLTRSNHTVAWLTELVHACFATVGFVVIAFPEGGIIRESLPENMLLLGQYLLFLVIAHAYLIQAAIEDRLEIAGTLKTEERRVVDEKRAEVDRERAATDVERRAVDEERQEVDEERRVDDEKRRVDDKERWGNEQRREDVRREDEEVRREGDEVRRGEEKIRDDERRVDDKERRADDKERRAEDKGRRADDAQRAGDDAERAGDDAQRAGDDERRREDES